MRGQIKWKVGLLLVGLLFVWAMPVLAGGWATIDLISMPDEIHAGEVTLIEFIVSQHGKTPVHSLNWNKDETIAVTPIVKLTNSETGEALQFAAYPTKEVGYFAAEITFPTAGTWSWDIAPQPLGGATTLSDLAVLPEVETAVPTSGFNGMMGTLSDTAVWPWAVGLLLVGLVVLCAWRWRTRLPSVSDISHRMP